MAAAARAMAAEHERELGEARLAQEARAAAEERAALAEAGLASARNDAAAAAARAVAAEDAAAAAAEDAEARAKAVVAARLAAVEAEREVAPQSSRRERELEAELAMERAWREAHSAAGGAESRPETAETGVQETGVPGAREASEEDKAERREVERDFVQQVQSERAQLLLGWASSQLHSTLSRERLSKLYRALFAWQGFPGAAMRERPAQQAELGVGGAPKGRFQEAQEGGWGWLPGVGGATSAAAEGGKRFVERKQYVRVSRLVELQRAEARQLQRGWGCCALHALLSKALVAALGHAIARWRLWLSASFVGRPALTAPSAATSALPSGWSDPFAGPLDETSEPATDASLITPLLEMSREDERRTEREAGWLELRSAHELELRQARLGWASAKLRLVLSTSLSSSSQLPAPPAVALRNALHRWECMVYRVESQVSPWLRLFRECSECAVFVAEGILDELRVTIPSLPSLSPKLGRSSSGNYGCQPGSSWPTHKAKSSC